MGSEGAAAVGANGARTAAEGQPGRKDTAADAAGHTRNNELSELSEEEQKTLWANCNDFEDCAAKLEGLYNAKKARYS
eukprot:6410172-Pyramimonas_sp.AAC.1